MSSTAAHSSSLCIVPLGRPKSTTGHSSIRKRPSEVPPLVDSSGVRPVSSSIAATMTSYSCAGRSQEGLAGDARTDCRTGRLSLGDLFDHSDQVGTTLQVVEADVELAVAEAGMTLLA